MHHTHRTIGTHIWDQYNYQDSGVSMLQTLVSVVQALSPLHSVRSMVPLEDFGLHSLGLYKALPVFLISVLGQIVPDNSKPDNSKPDISTYDTWTIHSST